MRGLLERLALALAVTALAVTALAAPAAAVSSAHRCTVVEGGKLPADTGGPEALCAAVEQAIASAAPGVPYKAEIRVLSRARLAAILVVGGRTLPQQNFAIMDRELNRGAIERFAQSLGAEVAKAHSH